MARCHKTIKLNFISKAGITLLPCVFARKYRGELRSVATRRGVKKTSNGSNRVNPPPLRFATQNIGEVSVRTEGLKIPSVKVIEEG